MEFRWWIENNIKKQCNKICERKGLALSKVIVSPETFTHARHDVKYWTDSASMESPFPRGTNWFAPRSSQVTKSERGEFTCSGFQPTSSWLLPAGWSHSEIPRGWWKVFKVTRPVKTVSLSIRKDFLSPREGIEIFYCFKTALIRVTNGWFIVNCIVK